MIKEAGVGPFKKDVCESYKQLDLVCVNLERKMWREREREREREKEILRIKLLSSRSC